MNLQDLKQLIEKYNAGQASSEEVAMLEKWYDRIDGTDAKLNDEQTELIKQEIHSAIRGHISIDTTVSRKNNASPKIRSLYRYSKWAAAAILIIAGASLFFFHKHSPRQIAIVKRNNPVNNDIAPGTQKAILTFANGSNIILDSAKNGVLSKQGNNRVIKSNGQLIYAKSAATASNNTQLLYNTVTTPRGGEYRLTLADGTQVWLNSASSLTYPTDFTGKERLVKLTGEAYFEVVHNAKMPFKVNVNGKEEVQVLGTHFNIMAYTDERAIKTTLLEGSVKIARDKEIGVLTPGQQAQLTPEGKLAIVDNADIDEVMAWKNGQTLFVHQDIKTIMRQVSRWYDVDVEYKGNIPDRFFTGGISRKSNLSALLKILELNDVHFIVNGTKLIVTP